jgi:outer membrane immunogenic protein
VTRVGWTLGAGVEAKLSGNWIARGEYRYANFGTWNDVLNLSLPGAATTVAYGLKVETHIATFGLAYKFGGPVVARY